MGPRPEADAPRSEQRLGRTRRPRYCRVQCLAFGPVLDKAVIPHSPFLPLVLADLWGPCLDPRCRLKGLRLHAAGLGDVCLCVLLCHDRHPPVPLHVWGARGQQLLGHFGKWTQQTSGLIPSLLSLVDNCPPFVPLLHSELQPGACLLWVPLVFPFPACSLPGNDCV